jgi:hypothetical protein
LVVNVVLVVDVGLVVDVVLVVDGDGDGDEVDQSGPKGLRPPLRFRNPTPLPALGTVWL